MKTGDSDAKFIQGTFTVMAGESSANWDPSAPILRLGWIEMARFGGVESIAYLNQAGMIVLAESLVYKP